MDTHNAYNYAVIRQFTVMAVVWAIVGMIIGSWIAAEMAFPDLNLGIPWLTFSRLRPLHTNIIILAFSGSILFASSYYVVQHTCQTRLFSNNLANLTFWGWQLAMMFALLTLPLGMSSGKEYAELEWPIDIMISLVLIVYAIVFFGTLARRKTTNIYIANWFFSAYILAFIVLYLINNIALPISWWPMKSYSLYSGVVDAMVTWWYAHNFIGLFLSVGFLGALYYFLPKLVKQPLYSYQFAVIHFFAMITFATWSAPQHLIYSALPDWTQSLGIVFSVLLLIPFWGGLINCFMTISKSQHKIAHDPILKFIVAALIFYGLSTIEGPIMAIRAVNAVTHYTDFSTNHAHSGGLGWFGLLSIALIYLLIPKVFNRKQIYSIKLANVHFWLAMIGIILYLIAMICSGLTQSKMWHAFNDDGTLAYRFIDSIQMVYDFYILRLLGGIVYLIGMLLMAYNVWKTIYLPITAKLDHGNSSHHKTQITPAEHSKHDHHAHDAKHGHSHSTTTHHPEH